MIKLKRLLTEVEHIPEIFIWMDPRGNIVRLPTQGHSTWAKNYISTILSEPIPNDVYGKMYDLGWIRVSIMGYMGINGVHFNTRKGKTPSSYQVDSMIELAKAYNATEIIDDTNGGVYMDIY